MPRVGEEGRPRLFAGDDRRGAVDKLKKQRRQLEEEVEAEQHPMAPSTMK